MLSTIFFGEYIEAIRYVKIALGMEDWINKTPAAYPDKLKILIKINPIIGPIITRPIDDIKELLKEKTFIWVKDTPRDIKIKTIIVYPSNITVFRTDFGISRSKYKKVTAIITAYVDGLFNIILISNFLLARNIFTVKCKSTTNDDIAAATPIPKEP